ncbi:hypothetical protein Rfer_3835 [Rhodoferax ferrireducens T118]|uniref:Uncharacterized protein n=1 Tax=Albidiferax ferrireducens (strain ATCC BAA-621 / DSM 15236 / T118) TaxID=338969 RepID=Q21RR9_ALBFT|nr:hypothetical protein Rfer_3835 [Rhodoferax ferrireducens T118]
MSGYRGCLLFGRCDAARTGCGFGAFSAASSTKLSTEVVHQWRAVLAASLALSGRRLLRNIYFFQVLLLVKLRIFLLGACTFWTRKLGLIPAACLLGTVLQPAPSKGLPGCP